MDPIAFLAMFAGGVICFFGYPMIHSAIRVWGFLLAGVGAVLIALGVFHIPGSLTQLTLPMGVAFVIGGVIGALIAAPLSMVVIFFSGTALGALAGIYAYPLIARAPESTLLTVILALITGFLAVSFQEVVLIVTTAFVGALMLVYGARTLMHIEILPLLGIFFLIGFFGAAAQYKSIHPTSSLLGV